MYHKSFSSLLHEVILTMKTDQQNKMLQEYSEVFEKYKGKLCIEKIQREFYIAFKKEKKEKETCGLSLSRRTGIVASCKLEYYYRKNVLNEKSI